MVRRAARDDVHAVDEVELLGREVQLVYGQMAVHQAPGQRVADDAGLLVDLLHHEVGVAALLGHVDVPINVRDLRVVDLLPGRAEVADAGRRELRGLAVAQHHHVAGGVDERDHVRCNVGAVRALPHHQRGVLAHGHDRARLGIAGHGQRIGADEPRGRLAHGLQQVARVRLLHQVRHHLGVGLARELVAPGGQLVAQFGEVLDDAVVDDGDMAAAGCVRVRVALAGAAVRGPARVADAARAR